MQGRLRNGLLAGVASIIVAATVAGVAIAAGPGPISGGPAGSGVCASPATAARAGTTVGSLRAFGDCEITRRLTTLSQLAAAVGAAKGLTSSDAAALNAVIGAATTGLTSLKAALDTQTAPAALRGEIVQIVTKYRVYELLGPQVRLTIAAEGVLALKPHFDDIAATLATRIASAQAKGKDVGTAQTALAAMNTAASAAGALAAPLPAQLLAFTPDKYGAGTPTALQTIRTALGKARDDLKAAAQDGRNVIAALK
jgi:hypothetical protein